MLDRYIGEECMVPRIIDVDLVASRNLPVGIYQVCNTSLILIVGGYVNVFVDMCYYLG